MPLIRSINPRRFAVASFLVLVALVGLLAFARPAAAANICVGSHPNCSVPDYPATVQGIRDALAASNNNALYPGGDIVYIAAGLYEPTTSSTIGLSSPHADLQIVGAGQDQTIISANSNSMSAISIFNPNGHDVTVTKLTFRNAGWGNGHAAVSNNVDFDDVEFEAISTTGNIRGLYANGVSTISNSRFTLSGANVSGIYSDESPTVRDSEFVSLSGTSTGFYASGNGFTRTLERVSMRNMRVGITLDSGSVNVFDTFILLSSSNGARGIDAGNSNFCGTCVISAVLNRSTVVGTGPNQVGFSVEGTGPDGNTESGSGVANNSLFHLTGSGAMAMRCTKTGDSTTASLNTSFVAAETARVTRNAGDQPCAGTDSSFFDTTSTPPLFNFAAVGDYRPASASPMIDAGDPSAVIGPTDKDADGLDRLVDGDNDPGDVIDIGAHEFQAAMKPSPVQISASPNPANVGQLIDLSALSVEPDGGSISYAWDFGDGNSDTGNNLQHSYSAPGDYTITVTATDNELDQTVSTLDVHVSSDPPSTPSVSAVPNDFAFRGSTVTFTASGSTDLSGDDIHYEWTFTGGGTDTSLEGEGVDRFPSQLVSGAGPTLYTATVKAVDEHGEESPEASASVTIKNHMPTINNILRSKTSVVRGEEVDLTIQATDPESDVIISNWDFDDGLPGLDYSNYFTVQRSWSSLGTKTITVLARDGYYSQAAAGEVEDSYTTTIDVVNQDPILGSIAHSGTLLAGDAQSFSLPANDGDSDPLTYTWNYGDGQSETTGASGSTQHAYSAPGNYTVTATVTDGFGGTVAVQRTITVASRQAVITLGKPTKRFVLRGKGFALGGKPPYAYIPIKSSEPVSLRLTLTHVKGGYTKGKSCVKRKVGRKRCDLKLPGSQQIDLLGTSGNLMFGGKWRRSNLKPGKYRVTLTPADGGPAKSVVISVYKKKR